ncbi:MAG: WhiB family transcriptional regulator [Propionibacteriaceae bacterium]
MSVSVLRPRSTDRLPCRDEDPEIFFPETSELLSLAKLACARCPIKVQCRAGAIERGEQYGVWGGQLILDGELVDTKRGRGRPRKHAVA